MAPQGMLLFVAEDFGGEASCSASALWRLGGVQREEKGGMLGGRGVCGSRDTKRASSAPEYFTANCFRLCCGLSQWWPASLYYIGLPSCSGWREPQ
eukprot:scaffold3640_cov159-Pinguiococcus_pyrenoidosus.AAC.1